MKTGSKLLTAALLLGLVSGAKAEPLPSGVDVANVDFERHISSLLGTLGCNAASCHGSFQGRGGFRLSLFGHDSDMDFLALTRDVLGRRVQQNDPDQSLILLKASGQVSHGGGKRLDKNSWTYHVIRAWIAAGCPRGDGVREVKQIRVEPSEFSLLSPNQSVMLKIIVDYADGAAARSQPIEIVGRVSDPSEAKRTSAPNGSDGSETRPTRRSSEAPVEDITPFCQFRAQDETIASVSALGEVRGRIPGETPIVVSYKGHLTYARAFIPAPSARGVMFPEIAATNFIDREVFAKLRRLNILPSDLAEDTEFLRRLTIDTIGRLPTPAEIREFLADKRPDKRSVKIDQMLAHLDHAALWATKFCDITACNQDTMEGPREMTAKRAKMWHDWFRRRVADNVPYDRIVHGVLCATSRDGEDIPTWIRRETDVAQEAKQGFQTSYAERDSLDLFWRRFTGDEFFTLEQMAELTATAFMGVRIECAQCHKHPFDRWTQADYRAYANAFARVRVGHSVEVGSAIADILAKRRESGNSSGPPIPRIQEVYCDAQMRRSLTHRQTNEIVMPKALGGPMLSGTSDPREELFRWLVRPDNPYFARSFVNRVWAHYMGRGLVEPVDNFSAGNPASNERLLEALAREFVEHHYDIRRLERSILNARVYQLTSRPNDSNRADKTHYSHAAARPMMAEVVVDVLHSALGAGADLGADVPPGSRAIEIAPNRVQAPHLARIFKVFGRPIRATTCDCERPREPTIGQTLFLMTDADLLQRLENGRLKELLAGGSTDTQIVEELFLATMSRYPDEGERKAALDHLRAATNRAAGFRDMLWALVNTREFILNH